MQELDCRLSLDQGPMKSWLGVGEGRARKCVCCVGMMLVIHCGIVQHIEVLELRCRQA